MSKPTITAQRLGEILEKSNAVLSQKLTPEEYAEVTDEIAAINQKVTDLEAEKSTLSTENATLKTDMQNLEGEKTSLSNEKLILEAEVASLKPFKEKIEQIAATGRKDPGFDANSSAHNQVVTKPANHPDSIALANLKASGHFA